MTDFKYWLHVIIRCNGDANLEKLSDIFDGAYLNEGIFDRSWYEGIKFAENHEDYPIASNGYEHAVELEGEFLTDDAFYFLEWLGLKWQDQNKIAYDLKYSRDKITFWEGVIDDLAFDLTVQEIDEIDVDSGEYDVDEF